MSMAAISAASAVVSDASPRAITTGHTLGAEASNVKLPWTVYCTGAEVGTGVGGAAVVPLVVGTVGAPVVVVVVTAAVLGALVVVGALVLAGDDVVTGDPVVPCGEAVVSGAVVDVVGAAVEGAAVLGCGVGGASVYRQGLVGPA